MKHREKLSFKNYKLNDVSQYSKQVAHPQYETPQGEWVISFRANYSNQLTCIPFAVTNKALPVKGLAKDPHQQTHFSAILAHGCWCEQWHG